MAVTANVFYTCSDSYAPYAGISMLSLLENNRHIENLRVFVVGDHVLQENIDRFQKQANAYGREFTYIDGEPYIRQMKEFGMPTYRNVYAPNLRLFFSDWAEPKMARLLYLDCDTLVCGDISELFSLDMEDDCVAVVRDSLGLHYKKLIGYEKTELYANAGVILFDIKNWIDGNWGKKLLDTMKNPENRHPNTDQDYLNLALRGHMHLLQPKYNFQPVHKVYKDKTYYRSYAKDGYYSEAELMEARRNPVIEHTYRYLGRFPWHEKSWHPNRDEFLQYKSMSQWKDKPDETNRLSSVLKIERFLYRILPRFIFLKVFTFSQYWTFRREERQIRKK
jgi:lipopolysaccharide biosynthesis glycosyltransferase